MKTTFRHGYTMIEILLVVAVIGILIMLLVTSLGGVVRSARMSRVETEVMALEQAFRSYHQLYGGWPRHPQLGTTGDPETEANQGLKVNEHMVRLLRGENHPGQSGPHRAQNPRQVAFMEISDGSLGSDEDEDPDHFVDAWGNAYRFMFDFNLDNTVTISQYYSNGQPRELPGRTVAVWSLGPSGERPANKDSRDDNIRSWE